MNTNKNNVNLDATLENDNPTLNTFDPDSMGFDGKEGIDDED